MKKGKLVQLSNSANYRPSQGTTVTVYDLFHASPVRKKCLNECLELEWIKQRLEACALVHPSVSFSLRNDATGSLVLQTHKSSSVVGAVTHLFGVEHSQELCTFSNQTDIFQVRGYVSRVSCANRNVQFVFVNNRLVLKTKLHSLINCILSQSVILKQRQKSALVTRHTAEKKCENYFRATCHPGSPQNAVDKHGIYILMITCPLSEYEITFDPTKTLVEFKHWCILLKCVKNSLWECLEKEGLVEPPNLNEPAISKQFEVVDNNELTQDTCTANCDTSVKCYGKGIHACNISNNLQSNTVRRPVKDVISITEGVDTAELIEQIETNSQHSCSRSVSCGTVPGAVLSTASNCAGDFTSKDNECNNRDNNSGMTPNARLSKANYKKHARNNDKTSTSCVISEDTSCRSEAIFKSTSPTKLSHADLAKISRNNSVLECSSNNGTDNRHCQQGHPESNDVGQTQRSYKQTHERTCKITSDVSQSENRTLSFQSINLTQMLESSGDPTEESSDDVIVRDHTFISLGTQDSYSSMNFLMDRGRQSSVPSTRTQIASLKMVKEQLREDLSSQSSQLSSSLRSFKRDIGAKDRHKWLAGLSHVREKLNQPHAQDRTRVSQEGKRNRESHCDGRLRTAEFKRSSWQESQTSLADSVHRHQPRRELVSKHGHCECLSDIPGVSRTGGITQAMCHGLPLQYPNHPAGGGIIESNDTNTEEWNTIPNIHKRLASVDFISPKAKMTQYHHFTKVVTEIRVKQHSDQCVNSQALSCQRVNIHNQISRRDSKWRNQVNNLDSNSGKCNDPVNRFDSDYDQCGDHINIFDFGYGQYGHDQVNSLHPPCAESYESETSTEQQTETDATDHRRSFQQKVHSGSVGKRSGRTPGKRSGKTPGKRSGRSLPTSEDLLPGAQWITGEVVRKDTREEVRKDTREEVRTDTGEVVRKDTREEVRKDTREEVRTDTGEVDRKDTREEIKTDTGEMVRKDTREEVKTDTGEVVRKDTREEVKKDTGEVVRKDTREEVKTDTGEVIRNLGGNVEKHLAEEDQKLDVPDRITNRGDQVTCPIRDKAPEGAIKNIGYISNSTLSLDSCSKDHIREVGNTIESNNTICFCTQGTSIVGTTTNPELVAGVGLSDKAQHESIKNRLMLHLPDTQDLEMTHDVESVDDHQEGAATTSSQLVPHPGLIVCNSEYDVEFVPFSVDVSDLESPSPGAQSSPTDVEMSPHVTHCSQESEGFQVSVLTDKLSPTQQDWDPEESVGMSMTYESLVGDMSTQPFYVTSEMTTQPFEVTHEFQMDPTKPDSGSRVTIAASSISAAQPGPDNDKVLFI